MKQAYKCIQIIWMLQLLEHSSQYCIPCTSQLAQKLKPIKNWSPVKVQEVHCNSIAGYSTLLYDAKVLWLSRGYCLVKYLGQGTVQLRSLKGLNL